MAKGRMLQKRISKSNKMTTLSSDTVRLLYTWILPHLDVNGNFYADPVMVNNLVFTRLGHSVDTITNALDELEATGLIIRYEVDGEKYLNYPDFKEKQPKLNEEREGKSDIPNITQELLKSKSRVTPTQYNISKDNIREANATPEQLTPVDNSAPKPEPKTEIKAEPVPEAKPAKNAFFEKRNKEFSEVMAKIKAKYNYKEQQEIENWIKANYRGKHPDALIHTLNSIVHPVRPGKPDISISLYLDKVIALENQNYNAADFDAKAAEFKKPGLFSMSDIFAGMKLHAGATT